MIREANLLLENESIALEIEYLQTITARQAPTKWIGEKCIK
jgi:hypothetical protein